MLSNIAIQRASTGICVKNWGHATQTLGNAIELNLQDAKLKRRTMRRRGWLPESEVYSWKGL